MGMLILTKREGESIRIITPDGTEIVIKYLGKVGIDAPKNYHIERIDREGMRELRPSG